MRKHRRLQTESRSSSGQALLVAVLIMVLLALLGAAFVTLISYNLAQTARYEDILTAKKMAESGLQYADDMLTQSDDGADWRPHDSLGDTSAATTRAGTSGYYDAVERARGWADGTFIKYPDPLRPTEGDFHGGGFLLRVDYNPIPGVPLTRFIKITSIGRCSNNPNAFYRMVGYKALPLTDYARFVTGWDTATDSLRASPPTAALGFAAHVDFDNDESTTTTLSQNSVQPDVVYVNRDVPFGVGDYIQIGGDVRKIVGFYVAEGSNDRALFLDSNLSSTPSAGTSVTRVDSGGTVVTEDTDGDAEKSQSDAPIAEINGPLRIQGNVAWAGNVLVSLRTVDPTYLRDDRVEVAGTIGRLDAGTPDEVRIRLDSAATATPVSMDSSDASFDSRNGRYVDSRGRATGSTSAAADLDKRWVEPVAPPIVFDPNDDWHARRYERLTRLSDNAKVMGSEVTSTVGELGYGPGLYINNVGNTNNLASPGAIPAEWTTTDPEPGSNHWDNNLEYIPPGAELVLTAGEVDPTGTAIGTTHSTSRAPHVSGVPVLWIRRDPNDTANTVYTYDGNNVLSAGQWYTVDYPANGIILAEGNLRVRGVYSRDLVILSKGTVYIEGPVVAAVGSNAHLALFAKEHVCVNTTQFLHRPLNDPSSPFAALTRPQEGKNGDSCWSFAPPNALTLTREIYPTAIPTGGVTGLILRQSGEMKAGLEIRYRTEVRSGHPLPESSCVMTVNDNASPPPDERLKTRTTSQPLHLDEDLATQTLAGLTSRLQSNFGKYDYYDAIPGSVPGPAALLASISTPRDIRGGPSQFVALPVVTTAGVYCNGGTPIVNLGGNTNDYGTRDASFYQLSDLEHVRLMAAGATWTTQRGHRTYVVEPLTVGSGAGQLHQSAGATNTLTFQLSPTTLTGYRLCRFKFEHLDATGYPTQGLNIDIEALIYAQEGSWFIIPGQYFDNTMTNSPGKDGVWQPGDNQATRARRYNYALTVHGAVVENRTADDGSSGTETSKYQYEWQEKWSWPRYIPSGADGIDGPWSADATEGIRWTGPQYEYDPSLRPPAASPISRLPKLPVHSGFVYMTRANS